MSGVNSHNLHTVQLLICTLQMSMHPYLIFRLGHNVLNTACAVAPSCRIFKNQLWEFTIQINAIKMEEENTICFHLQLHYSTLRSFLDFGHNYEQVLCEHKNTECVHTNAVCWTNVEFFHQSTVINMYLACIPVNYSHIHTFHSNCNISGYAPLHVSLQVKSLHIIQVNPLKHAWNGTVHSTSGCTHKGVHPLAVSSTAVKVIFTGIT